MISGLLGTNHHIYWKLTSKEQDSTVKPCLWVADSKSDTVQARRTRDEINIANIFLQPPDGQISLLRSEMCVG